MKFKKIIKNTIIFATMMLVIGVYTAPVISKAGDDVWYGASFDFDGDTYYTDRKVKTRHHLFGCLARTKILMVLISMQKFML